MIKSYSLSYIKIYLWQIISVLLGFASLLIVIPFLSENKIIYGIYSICISLTIFYRYGNIGFLTSGDKYASECYARNELRNEVRIIAFTSFIYMVLVVIISIIIYTFSRNPALIISEISDDYQMLVAQRLLTIMAISSPLIVLQRSVQSILSIRIKGYVFQQISIIGSVLKILSVYFYFSSDQYNIVNYYIFIQVINFLVLIISVMYLHYSIKYPWVYFIKQFRYNSETYDHVKKLAFSSFALTISWILYYEIDLFVIGKVLGAQSAATFAIALSVLTIFRSIFGILYSPYPARFNHFKGLNEIHSLEKFFMKIIKIFIPVTVVPVIATSIIAKSFILSWVGPQYLESSEIVSILVLCNILAFMSYPAGSMLIAIEKRKVLYWSSIISVFVYWGGVLGTYSYIGLRAFAFFKLVIFLYIGIVYAYQTLTYFNIRRRTFYRRIIRPSIVPIMFTLVLSFLFRGILPIERSGYSLLLNVLGLGIIVTSGICISLISSKEYREFIFSKVKGIFY
jgi:O-antigen/teichoic acid export membrane protein